jgi:hypothetical protein
MSKRQIPLYLRTITIDALQVKAAELGVPPSALADLWLNIGRLRVPDDVLRQWAARRPSTRGRLAGGLTKRETSALAALEHLLRGPSETGKIAAAAGMPRRDAYTALASLRGRGLVTSADSPTNDRWGRPLRSIWTLTAKVASGPG